MNFTKTEIALCREIARYYRKPIGYGDWYYYKPNQECIPNIVRNGIFDEKLDFPLWTFEDAREWLKGKGFVYIDLSIQTRSSFISASTKLVTGKRKVKTAFGVTSLEAILKVVLAVSKEGI